MSENTNGGTTASQPQPRTGASLAGLTITDIPAVEILVIDEIANWIFSPENPGKGYSGEHGGAVVTAVLKAVQNSAGFRPARVPESLPVLTAMRSRLLSGIHEIGGNPEALSMFVITLMPAVISELERRSGDPASQVYWLYCYSLLVLAGGRLGRLDQDLMPAIMASFDSWNELMSAGYTLPWRAA